MYVTESFNYHYTTIFKANKYSLWRSDRKKEAHFLVDDNKMVLLSLESGHREKGAEIHLYGGMKINKNQENKKLWREKGTMHWRVIKQNPPINP